MKKGKTSKLISTAAMLLCLIISLTSITYSWIKREWTPNVSGNDIRIASDGSLVFSMQDTSGERVPGSIQDKMNLSNKETLRPVSSQDGLHGTFFNVKYEGDDDEWKFKHLDEEGRTEDALMKAYGYTEVVFLIQPAEGEGKREKNKYIFLTPKCEIVAKDTDQNVSIEAAQAMRVAIDIQKQGSTTTTTTLMFKNQDVDGDHQLLFDDVTGKPLATHKGITAEKKGNTYIANDANYEAEYVEVDGVQKPLEIERQINVFSNFYGGIWEEIPLSEVTIVNNKITQAKINGVMTDLQKSDSKTQSYQDYYHYDTITGKAYRRNYGQAVTPEMCIGVLAKEDDYLQMKIRVWLEGCDDNCDARIRDYFVSLCVMFDFVDQ